MSESEEVKINKEDYKTRYKEKPLDIQESKNINRIDKFIGESNEFTSHHFKLDTSSSNFINKCD